MEPTPAIRRYATQGLRNTGQALADTLSWAAGFVVAAWVRYDFTPAGSQLRAVLYAAAIAAVLNIAIGYPLFLYRGRYAFGGFDEVRSVFCAVSITTGALFLGNLVASGPGVPISTPLTGGALALVCMFGIRSFQRVRRERTMRPNVSGASSVLVIGAGNAGTGLVRSMLRDPHGKYLPVGLVDDDPVKRHLRVDGVAVLGNRADLPRIVAQTGVCAIVFAIPSADPALIRETRQLAEASGVAFKVLPSVTRMIDRPVTVSDVRDVDVTDLIGRGQVQTDIAAIAGYLKGRRVLVTGAGGSIGSELCRQIHRYSPAELIMLDRDETSLHDVQLSIHGRAMLDDPEVVLADLRDSVRIRSLFAERRPQVVFHTAALKHQPLLEQCPAEAIKTNVWGTSTILEAAADFGVEVLVNISTDKAANPCSVLGYSKRIAERLTSHVAREVPGRYMSVRFGNVFGSRGSVITTFAAQIAGGGPITVTDPRVTRYFMTIHEAVQLVIQAGAVGGPGEALVMDMGEPVRITDLARQMAALANEPVEIVYVGLRPGEKLRERLFGTGERDTRRSHPLISHVDVPPLDPTLALAIDPHAAHDMVIGELISLCDTDRPVPNTLIESLAAPVA